METKVGLPGWLYESCVQFKMVAIPLARSLTPQNYVFGHIGDAH